MDITPSVAGWALAPKKPFNFDELSEGELVVLTPEQIARVIDFSCAEAGIKLLGDPPELPATATIAEDQTAYTIGDLHFWRAADAEAVADFARQFDRVKDEYIPGPGYKKRWEPVPPHETIPVVPQKHYSANLAAQKAELIRQAEQQRKTYDADKMEYDTTRRKRSEVAEAIMDRVNAAQRNESRRADLRLQFARYLDLAEGQRRVACRFMVSAYPDAATMIPDVFAPDEEGPIPTGRAYNLDQEEVEI